ncbi:uncharacterized protein LOC100254864 isoform X2 [Vitis vinifera]|uniref:uncharacterized protein LOC100254864 isoform X2 n=1 Tax=Vitis vinifera TaxID=29760 RepID=UPI0008FEBABD|nr:uncharacterized protein LOC100254864 isoform X2 [Vitis vinifera]|eukprot:XP_019078844.1 PREDICTED: uncharacterized protein LOC100254864 isoform X2 [Vitis vinifera]
MVMVQMKGSMLSSMTPVTAPTLQFKSSGLFGTHSNSISFLSMPITNSFTKAMVIEARANAKKDSAKIRNRRLQRKEAAERVGEELVKACIDHQINEISSYDRNGFARGERMQAFEIAISRHGFLPR